MLLGVGTRTSGPESAAETHLGDVYLSDSAVA